jgi:thermolysin
MTAAQGPNTNGFRALSGAEAANFIIPGDVQLTHTIQFAKYDLAYERYQQYFANAAVLGAQLTLYRDTSGTVVTVIGAHYPNIVPVNTVNLSEADVLAIVEQDIGPDGDRIVDIHINPQTGHYFYQVETRRFDSRWAHWIDAERGQILNKFNTLTYDCGDQAAPCGFGVEYDASTPTDIKDLSGLTTSNGPLYELRAADGRQETHNHRSSQRSLFLGLVARDRDDEWTKLGDEFLAQQALVDAHYYGNVTDDYYLQQHSFDWVAAGDADPDHNISAMVLNVHYGQDYNNAFWNGRFVVFGDGDQQIFRELTSLDVVAHELTHGVTDFTSNLIYMNESGALNEAFSDIMAGSVEFYADLNHLEPAITLTPDWYVGEDFDLREDTVPGFRNMEDPEEDGHPDHYTERQVGGGDNGGVHINSGIPNHAYFLLVNGGLNASCASPEDHNSDHCFDDDDPQDNNLNVTPIGLTDAESIFFLGFVALTENATMCDARAATEAATTSLFGDYAQQQQSTTDAWVAVGLTDAACGKAIFDTLPAPQAPIGMLYLPILLKN